MKKEYFTRESIENDGLLIQNSISAIHSKTPFRFDPDKAGLLILDMQQYFLDKRSHAFIPTAPAIVHGLIELITAFQEIQRPVILTRHKNTSENAGSLSRWWNDVLPRDNPMGELHPTILQTGAEVMDKTQYDAFYNTDLETRLRDEDVTQVVIGGVMTHLCCETTARSAFVRDFDVFFLVDGTATYNLNYHLSSLRNLSHGFGSMVRVREIVNRVRDHEPSPFPVQFSNNGGTTGGGDQGDDGEESKTVNDQKQGWRDVL